MRLPNQSVHVERSDHLPLHKSAGARQSAGVSPCAAWGMSALSGGATGPGPAAVDHTIFRMMLSGCRCISPNCVAMSCPAGCVSGGRFVC